jgi:hypothetical protein
MRRKANRISRKTPIKVVLDIKPGPASPAQRAAWKRLWDKLLSEVKAKEPEGGSGQ